MNILTFWPVFLHSKQTKTQKMSKQTLKEAIEIYGKTIVSEVVNLVYMADADGSYSTFQDMGMDEHAECTEFLFFS